VQPNIPQADKIQLRFAHRNWERLLSLSEKPAPTVPTVIVWPEAAADPYLRYDEFTASDDIVQLTAKGAMLMTGAIRPKWDPDGALHYYNSVYVFGRGGVLLASYDKFHLVPFGEYLPFEKTLGELGLTKLTGINGGFASGDGPHTYNVPGAPSVGPLICYEILFPDAVVGASRPSWFVNVTDDSWFGPWAGPQQHLLAARVRAIEEGIPVARAANTGISAIIDPLGRITAKLGLDRLGIVDGDLPAAIVPTPYSRLRDGWFLLLLSACMGLAWMLTRGK
jgi:apolipoprotein N-acyltransferase